MLTIDEQGKMKKVQFIIINKLGKFKLNPFEMKEDEILQMLKWFKNSEMDNFSGKIADWGIIFPSAILKESVFKYLEIKD